MKRIKKQLIGSLIVNVLSFAFLSYIFISLMIAKQDYDVILLYALSCFFMIVWIVLSLFTKRIHHFLYRNLHKSFKLTWQEDVFGAEIASEENSFNYTKSILYFFPYISYLFLSIGLFILYLS